MGGMTKQTKKTRTRYNYHNTKWTRRECAEWVKSKKCPECKTQRLYPGQDHDRFTAICLECGHRFAIKPPKEAVC